MTPEQARQKPGPFSWDDPFLLDEQLTEEERLIRDSTRAYAQEKLLPRAFEWNRTERRWVSSACSGRPSPRNSAAPAPTTFPTASSPARSSASTAATAPPCVQSSLVMHPIFAYGTEEQKSEVPAEARQRASGSAASA
jgi:glutaryl-CoA dehydrogenase